MRVVGTGLKKITIKTMKVVLLTCFYVAYRKIHNTLSNSLKLSLPLSIACGTTASHMTACCRFVRLRVFRNLGTEIRSPFPRQAACCRRG